VIGFHYLLGHFACFVWTSPHGSNLEQLSPHGSWLQPLHTRFAVKRLSQLRFELDLSSIRFDSIRAWFDMCVRVRFALDLIWFELDLNSIQGSYELTRAWLATTPIWEWKKLNMFILSRMLDLCWNRIESSSNRNCDRNLESNRAQIESNRARFATWQTLQSPALQLVHGVRFAFIFVFLSIGYFLWKLCIYK